MNMIRNVCGNYAALFLTVLMGTSLLVGCGGGAATKPESNKPGSTSSANKPGSSKGGGYYLDDGPGDNPPSNIDSIPDAVVKNEAPSPRANKPYTALGERYVPMTSYAPYKRQGIASWYGKRYHGKKTSNGEIYDMYGMSGAHPTLPLPSYVRVTNPANGRSVIVRINDRGPFKHDRLIDLSYAAAYKLRLTSQGSGLVEVEAINANSPIPPVAIAAPANDIARQNTEIQQQANVSNPSLTISPDLNSEAQQYYVQVGAFRSEANGDMLQRKIQSLELAENVGLANVYNNGLYRVRLGPYANKAVADSSAAKIRKQLNISAIVQLQ